MPGEGYADLTKPEYQEAGHREQPNELDRTIKFVPEISTVPEVIATFPGAFAESARPREAHASPAG
jgi:hypothetical protein